jgi:predicted DNA-binding transcriptional regulator AlpA
MRDELKAALSLAGNLPAEELPRLLGDLEEVRAVALMRLTTRETKSQTDELLDVQQVAARLHMSADYVYRHAKIFPFTVKNRTGRALRFSSSGLASYLKQKSK